MARSDEENEKNQKEDQSPRFRVSDRRGQSKAAEPSPEPPPASEPRTSGAEKGVPPPEITFTTFVFSLSSSALAQLGEIPDPFTKKVEQNLPIAQQTIDLLGMLEQKTRGNLSDEEKKTLEAVLYDLRLRFLKASGRI